MQTEITATTVLTEQNYNKYESQLTRIGISQAQFDLHQYLNEDVQHVQQIINNIRMMHRTKRH